MITLQNTMNKKAAIPPMAENKTLFNEEDTDNFNEQLENAWNNNSSIVIQNDNIMNTYCVLNFMLQKCNQIKIYCGEARLFTKKGKRKLEEIGTKNAVEKLYTQFRALLGKFLSNERNSIEIISEREISISEPEKELTDILGKNNFRLYILKEHNPKFDFHFMVGDNNIYRRELEDKSKKGRIRITGTDQTVRDSCMLLNEIFETCKKNMVNPYIIR